MSTKKFFFVMLGLIAVSFVAVALAFYWGSGQLEKKSTALSDLIADRDVTQEAIIKLNKAQGDVENLDEVSALLDRLLPLSKQQENLIADILYTSTSEAGIPSSQVTSFSFTGTGEPNDLSGTTTSKENPGVYEYPFTMNISSISYDTLLKLLVEIETNGRIIQVDNVQITPQGDGTLNVALSMKAYLKP